MLPRNYLVGRPIYRGASNAPTRGTVDPMGYINRAMGMSPVGRDGFSDKRSGLASAALERLRNARGGVSGHPHAPMHMGLPQPPLYHPNQQINLPDPNQSSPIPTRRGFTVSPTGQLLPDHPNPYDATMAMMSGTPEAPNEAQLMQAARDRMMHHHQVMEARTKHQLNMQRLHMQAVEHVNRHRKQVQSAY